MKQYDSVLEQLFDVQPYNSISKSLEDFQKLTLIYKKFFTEILQRQFEFCETNISLSQKLLKSNQPNTLFRSLENTGQFLVIYELFSNVKNANTMQQNNLQQYLNETNEWFQKCFKYKDEYITNAIKFYKNDQQEYKKYLEHLKQKKIEYQDALNQYKQIINDPSMVYNYNLKSKKYSKVTQRIKKVKDCEQHIKNCLEILNSRRKSLCIDLIELKKIIEDLFQNVIFLTYKASIKNISTIIKILDQWSKQQQQQTFRTQKINFTILPDSQRFNFHQNGNRQIDFQQLLYEQRNLMNKIDADEIYTNYNEISFRSIKDISSLNQSVSSINDLQQMPLFFTQDIQQIPKSQLVQYFEWISIYIKDVKENCNSINNSIQKTIILFEGMMTSLKKQGRPCIELQGQKQSPFHQLKWFNAYEQFYGNIGVQGLQAYTQIHDLFNLFSMQLSVFLKPKLSSILNIQNQFINQQNIQFSSIDKQMFDLSNSHQNYLKQQGFLNDNRTISLSTMDSLKLQQTTQVKNEQQFRLMIATTNKTIVHLLIELENISNKYQKTMNEIIETINNQFNRQLTDILSFDIPEINQYIQKQCKIQTIQYLKTQKTFQIFYKHESNKNKSIIEDMIDENHDYQFISDFDYSDFSTLPKPVHLIDIDSIIDEEETEQSKKELDKEQTEQLQFIKTKLKMEINESLIGSYACALAEKIQLQGRLYITNKRLFFHSNFNSSNLFFGETILNIPKADILYIQKSTNAFIFDNSISIFTPKGQLFFATFFQRDKAYDQIIETFHPKEQPELLEQDSSQQQVKKIKLIPINFTEIQLELFQQRQIRIQKLIEQDPELFICETIFEIPEINIREFFKLIYGDKMTGQSITFYEKMKKGPLGNEEVALTQWNPQPPLEFDAENGQGNIFEAPDFIERNFSSFQPLPKSNIPFMPRKCECKEYQKAYFISLDCFVVDLKVQTYKVPYADAFYVWVRYKCQQEQQGIKIECKISNVFNRSVMVKKVIENASIDEITEKTEKKIFPAMKQELLCYVKGASTTEDNSIPEEKIDKQIKNSSQIFYKLGISGLIIVMLVLLYFFYEKILSKITVQIKFD